MRLPLLTEKSLLWRRIETGLLGALSTVKIEG
jgi:hypothetical protein